MGSKQKSTTTSSESRPPAYLEPHLQRGAAEAGRLYDYRKENPLLYPGATYVPFSPETESAMRTATQRATTSPLAGNVQGLLNRTVRGDYLGSNPWLDATYARGVQNMDRSILGSYGSANRTRSGGLANAGMNARAALAESLYGGEYENERRRQQQGIALAPSTNELGYADANELARVGAARESMSEAELADKMAKFYGTEGAQDVALEDYLRRIYGNPGLNFGTTTSKTPYYQNRTAGILGGAFSGASAGAPLGPWGVLGGGLLGGGLGALG